MSMHRNFCIYIYYLKYENIHPQIFFSWNIFVRYLRALFAKKLFSIFLEVQHKKVKYNGSTVSEKVLLSHLNGERTLSERWTNLNECRVNSVWTHNRIWQRICERWANAIRDRSAKASAKWTVNARWTIYSESLLCVLNL